MTTEVKLEDVRKMAAEAGLTHLSDDHLQELLRATKMAQARRAAMPPVVLTPADESGHVFRLDGAIER
jgi:hypothetical protein